MCIELLNNYRLAKESSAEAARALGCVVGEAFERKHRNTEELRLPALDNLTLEGEQRIGLLQGRFLGINLDEEFSGFIKTEGATRWIGVCLHNKLLANVEGNRVELEEAPFVEGFIQGFRKSRSERQPVPT